MITRVPGRLIVPVNELEPVKLFVPLLVIFPSKLLFPANELEPVKLLVPELEMLPVKLLEPVNELEPVKVWLASRRATLGLRRASSRVPLVMFVALRLVRSAPPPLNELAVTLLVMLASPLT